MKKVTILVIYTNALIAASQVGTKKRYSFNTEEGSVKEGDLIETPAYDSKLQVVKVLDQEYKYYNAATGDLSNEFTSSAQWEIKNLKIRDEEETNTIFGKIINRE